MHMLTIPPKIEIDTKINFAVVLFFLISIISNRNQTKTMIVSKLITIYS